MEKERRSIQSIEVGGQLLLALADHDGPMSLRDLAQHAGMSSAKAHPYLVSFAKMGLIQQDSATGRYGLGAFALQMGLVGLQLLDPVRIAIPEISSLAATIEHTVALATLGSHGPTIVYINESSHPIHVKMKAGTVMSAINTATGRIFSAYLSPGLVDELIDRELRDEAVTGQMTHQPAKKELEKLLADVRQRGMARAVGHPIPGINALSAPVFDHTRAVVLGITAIGPAGTFDASWNGEVAQRVRDCALKLSYRLGYRSKQ
jgi:DNA-binding IclR family transcriptional regulator